MKFLETKLKGAYVISLEPFEDERGLFARTFCKEEFKQIGHKKDFVQFNHSITLQKGTIRGLHYQLSPKSEIKLIRCVKGKAFDVIIDIRRNSPTFLQFLCLELAEENMKMIYLPEGFAHGFQTLEDDTHLIYHHSNSQNILFERGIRYNDPRLAIKWPLEVSIISNKDKSYPFLKEEFLGMEV
ncbi:dTDP-4-dehydrorhamnose 3,5-epimerase [Xanthovirga aplysinae]|uniref:dTDP-4-dehydrorhamnose 3,5-epimerase n=1 Tax=Xanthovirga aplysinae TaxID=2529853 RepID=UPI0012BC416E|nr:dTDP-4-dehydrorhamnose 3,5-epimerase [Xanthovirga aplysinae]MTI31181.1 dTDP-4-dehydrorhamnose 3,5-epimerase [Xanthovirga aplysinae]